MKKAMTKKPVNNVLSFKGPEFQTIGIDIVGSSQLVTNKFSNKAMQMMLDAQMGKTVHKEPKNPEELFLGSLHLMEKEVKLEHKGEDVYAVGRFGFPASCISDAIATASRFMKNDKVNQPLLRGLIWVEADDEETGLVEIRGCNKPKLVMHHVRNASGVADIRVRSQFWPWSMRLRISYEASAIQPSSVAVLLHRAGLQIGLGEGRKDKCTLGWGSFKLGNKAQVRVA